MSLLSPEQASVFADLLHHPGIVRGHASAQHSRAIWTAAKPVIVPLTDTGFAPVAVDS